MRWPNHYRQNMNLHRDKSVIEAPYLFLAEIEHTTTLICQEHHANLIWEIVPNCLIVPKMSISS